MKLTHTISHPSRVQDIRFCHRVGDESAELLLVGAEDKKVTIYDLTSGDETSLPVIGELVGHQNRFVVLATVTHDPVYSCIHIYTYIQG